VAPGAAVPDCRRARSPIHSAAVKATTLIRVFGIPAAVLALWAQAPSAEAQIYRWTDDSGTVHFTDSPRRIPERYREQLKTYKETEPDARALRAREKALTEFERDLAAEEAQREAAESEFLARKASWEQRLATARESLAQVDAELRDTRLTINRQALRRRKVVLKKEIEEAERVLTREIPREAASKGIALP